MRGLVDKQEKIESFLLLCGKSQNPRMCGFGPSGHH
jgi:hypothetical protein